MAQYQGKEILVSLSFDFLAAGYPWILYHRGNREQILSRLTMNMMMVWFSRYDFLESPELEGPGMTEVKPLPGNKYMARLGRPHLSERPHDAMVDLGWSHKSSEA